MHGIKFLPDLIQSTFIHIHLHVLHFKRQIKGLMEEMRVRKAFPNLTKVASKVPGLNNSRLKTFLVGHPYMLILLIYIQFIYYTTQLATFSFQANCRAYSAKTEFLNRILPRSSSVRNIFGAQPRLRSSCFKKLHNIKNIHIHLVVWITQKL